MKVYNTICLSCQANNQRPVHYPAYIGGRVSVKQTDFGAVYRVWTAGFTALLSTVSLTPAV